MLNSHGLEQVRNTNQLESCSLVLAAGGERVLKDHIAIFQASSLLAMQTSVSSVPFPIFVLSTVLECVESGFRQEPHFICHNFLVVMHGL